MGNKIKAHLSVDRPDLRVPPRHDLGVETNKVRVITRIILLAPKLEGSEHIPLNDGEKGVEGDHLDMGSNLVLLPSQDLERRKKRRSEDADCENQRKARGQYPGRVVDQARATVVHKGCVGVLSHQSCIWIVDQARMVCAGRMSTRETVSPERKKKAGGGGVTVSDQGGVCVVVVGNQGGIQILNPRGVAVTHEGGVPIVIIHEGWGVPGRVCSLLGRFYDPTGEAEIVRSDENDNEMRGGGEKSYGEWARAISRKGESALCFFKDGKGCD